MKIFIISVCIVCSFLILGCDDSDNIVNAPKATDGLSLLGLVDGRTLVYIQTDTIITTDPISISFSDTVLSVLITGAGNDWIIHNGSEKLVNLKVASTSILQNGYWKKINGQDSLIYYATPPLLFERGLDANQVWSYYTPFYKPVSAPQYLPYYYANFGFKVTKEYIGTETIITPAGEFVAYRYDLQLFTSTFGDEPIGEIIEYFVPNIGLVKQNTNFGALRRALILANYSG